MKRLIAASFLFLACLMAACQKEVAPTFEITEGSSYGDLSNKVMIDPSNHLIIITVAPYVKDAYRPNKVTLLLSVGPKATAQQVDANEAVESLGNINIDSQSKPAFRIDLAAYSNQNPARLRVGAVGTTTIGGTIYTVQIKVAGSLRVEGIVGIKGLWPDNADTVRVGLGSPNKESTIWMGVSNIYNGNKPGKPQIYVLNIATKEKIAVNGFTDSNERTLDVLTVNLLGLFKRPGTYNVIVETVDGRSAVSPFFVKILP
jgi:hypothetical protein